MKSKRFRWGKAVAIAGLSAIVAACATVHGTDTANENSSKPTGQQLAQKYGIPYHAVIGHRGAAYYAPEETRASYILARDLGADYLELDLQRTKDGHLIALHDTSLKRTTNIEDVFPDRADDPVSSFTLAELKQLDAGSWFNKAHPDRARKSYAGLKILTLAEVMQIAESGQNQPGLYLETKAPELFPGIEKNLADFLRNHHWIGPNARTAPEDFDDNKYVDVGYTPARVILQTFSKKSLVNLDHLMPDTPKVLLLYLGGGSDKWIPADDSIKQKPGEPIAAFRAREKPASRAVYDSFLDFAQEHGAIGVGPSTVRADLDPTYSYPDLAKPWMIKHAHQRGLLVHVYTLDDAVDFRHYFDRGVDGVFTNDSAALLRYEGRPPAKSVDAILKQHGY